MWGDCGDNNLYSMRALKKQVRESIVQNHPNCKVKDGCKEYVCSLLAHALRCGPEDDNDPIMCVIKTCPHTTSTVYTNISAVIGVCINEKNRPAVMQICYMIDKVSNMLDGETTITLEVFKEMVLALTDM